ncbi:hypothetical protein A2U01_0005494 [Trifolium medium]|uniref:Uncharacterized protein n=1 Tax=Trifolium medium TaxID=97028 RepID=A0A392MAX6_9FABA|nr:hypothetical protein [Trifolium medium]
MGDHQQEQADDLSPSLVLWDVITKKIYPFVIVTGLGYHIISAINHFSFYDFIRIFGWLAKGLLTGQYNKNPNPEQCFKLRSASGIAAAVLLMR